ncbi:outer membrane protein [Xanthobacter agilis]|jgi:outer membrane immunogenic protein|uniref:Outer membrane immunogenic protein n=1 Tax=Xanthobacter agilis TaxID=47492 RepID=A0ABU0LED8_XANAG|nr:outer membrane protein [Xanthobacter agilis]MDQ0505510.1 outer membrane immunogenic protein [Xanthobacter agilis]
MKRFLLATVALAALSAPAAAADLATKYPVKAIAAPVFSWTGFYIGANFGYGGDKFSQDLVALGVTVGSVDTQSSGWMVGGQLGYNYQFANNVVVGLETDLQWANISGQSSGINLGGTNWIAGSNVDYFGTIRARLGYAFDRFLPYITGGAAYGNIQHTLVEGYGVFPSVSGSNTSWGWTIGAGAEYAITNNWTFKAEYLYVDLGSSNSGVLDLVSLNSSAKFNTMRAGVNYKF